MAEVGKYNEESIIQAPFSSSSAIVFKPPKGADTKLGLPHYPPLSNIVFPLAGRVETKVARWGEWFIPAIGTGRTIIDLFPEIVLTLVRTTDDEGHRLQYLNLHVDNIRVWNTFVQNDQPQFHGRLPEVGIDVNYGSFPSGCGVTSLFDKTVELEADVFDAVTVASIFMSSFGFVYC